LQSTRASGAPLLNQERVNSDVLFAAPNKLKPIEEIKEETMNLLDSDNIVDSTPMGISKRSSAGLNLRTKSESLNKSGGVRLVSSRLVSVDIEPLLRKSINYE